MERGMRFPIEANFVDVAGVVGQTDADSTDSMDGVDVDLLLVRKSDQLLDIMDRVEGLKGSPLPTHQKEALFMYAKQLAAEVVHLLHLASQPQKRRSDRAYRRRYAA